MVVMVMIVMVPASSPSLVEGWHLQDSELGSTIWQQGNLLDW